MNNGWNLFSLPFEVRNNDVKNIFPEAVSSYGFVNEVYEQIDTLEPGQGYYIELDLPNENKTYTIEGLPVTDKNINIPAGQSLLPVFDSVISAKFLLDEGITFNDNTETITKKTRLLPGKSYWIRSSKDKTIDLGSFYEITFPSFTLTLKAGWNTIAFPLIPEDKNLLNIVQPLIDAGVLEKVVNNEGQSIIKLFGKWRNSIGNVKPLEGYRINVTQDTLFPLEGDPSNYNIKLLKTGWNMLGYPLTEERNALDVIQPLIDAGVLEKVVNNEGKSIIKLFGEWRNSIGNFIPGQGYRVKVTQDTMINIKN